MVCDKRSGTVLKEEQLPVELLMLCVNVMKFVNFMHITIFPVVIMHILTNTYFRISQHSFRCMK